MGPLLKDAVCVIDDFAAHGSSLDVQRLNAKADRVMRGQGNGAGRGRMNADGTLRPTKRSRSLIVATGEDKPNGHSLRARTCFLEIAPGTIASDQLATCQKDGAAGIYVQATASFCQWLAPQYHGIRASMTETINALRAKASGRHNRTPEITANLMFGWNTFVSFALDAGAIDMDAAESLTARAEAAFRSLAARQAAYQAASDPVERYIELLKAAIACGNAYIADMHGGAPPLSAACGLRLANRNHWKR